MAQALKKRLRNVDLEKRRKLRRRTVTKRRSPPGQHIPDVGQPTVWKTGKRGGKRLDRIAARLAHVMTKAATAAMRVFPCRCRLEPDQTGIPVMNNAECRLHSWIGPRQR